MSKAWVSDKLTVTIHLSCTRASGQRTCMASYMPMPAVTEPPGEFMNSLMSCAAGFAQ